MSHNLAWVKGLVPGQPSWVYEIIAEEFDRYDNKIAELRAQIERAKCGAGGKYSDIMSDGGMDPRNKPQTHPALPAETLDSLLGSFGGVCASLGIAPGVALESEAVRNELARQWREGVNLAALEFMIEQEY